MKPPQPQDVLPADVELEKPVVGPPRPGATPSKASPTAAVFDHLTPRCPCTRCDGYRRAVFMVLGELAVMFAWCAGGRRPEWKRCGPICFLRRGHVGACANRWADGDADEPKSTGSIELVAAGHDMAGLGMAGRGRAAHGTAGQGKVRFQHKDKETE